MKKVGIILSLGLLLQANNVRTSVCEDAFLGCVAYIQDAISPIIDQYRNTFPNSIVLRNYAFSVAQQLIIAAAPSQIVTTEPIVDEIDMTRLTDAEKAIEYPVALVAFVDFIIEYDAKVMTAALERERLKRNARFKQLTIKLENRGKRALLARKQRAIELARKKVVIISISEEESAE